MNWAREIVRKQTEPPTLDEMRTTWHDIDAAYCMELERQTTAEMLLNLADSQVEWMSIQDGTPFSDENVVIVKLLLRTRRFNQVVAAVLGQDKAGRRMMAGAIVSAIAKLDEMLVYLMTQSNSLPRIHSGEVHKQQTNLLFGDIASEQLTPERYGICGTRVALAANACLLGLCGEPEHLSVLMKLARPADPYIAYGTRFAAVDAMDRIMTRQQSNTSLGPEAQAVVTEYGAWRKDRHLPQRTVVSTFVYNSPGTPHNLSGKVAGQPKQMAGDFELPYVPACHTSDYMCLELGALDDQEKLRQHNDRLLKMNYPEGILREDPAVGLTIEDTRYIMRQSQRLAEITERK